LSKASAETKSRLLGQPHGTAEHRLRKNITFWLASRCKMLKCFRCHKQIERVNELSIEHKTSWQRSKTPKETFFDLKNIAFSHLKCNIRQPQNTCKNGHNNYAVIGSQRSCLTCRPVYRKRYRAKHPEEDKRIYRKAHGWV